MEEILKMLANYYIIFIILALIGIFAIIGYFIEKKHPRQEYKEPELDMEAVARKGGQGLGATLGQNPTTTDDEVEMLDMNMGPTTFVNNTTPASSNNTNTNLNNQETNKEQILMPIKIQIVILMRYWVATMLVQLTQVLKVLFRTFLNSKSFNMNYNFRII